MKTAEIGRRKSYVITDLGKEMVEKEYKRLRIMAEDGERYFRKKDLI